MQVAARRSVESAFCMEKRNVDVGGSEVKQGLARAQPLARFLRILRKPTDEVRPVKQPLRSWQHFALLAVILAAGALRTESDVHADNAGASGSDGAIACDADSTETSGCAHSPIQLAGR
jgi:hypothetical protein